MVKTLPLIVLMLSLAPGSDAKVTKLADADRFALVGGAKSVRMLTSTKAVPEEVWQACAAASKDGFEMAEPLAAFQLTDVLSSPHLPGRRLIWAARLPGYFLLHYERGGRAHSYHVALLRDDRSARTASLVWSAAANGLMKSFAQFLRAIDIGKLDDTREYAH